MRFIVFLIKIFLQLSVILRTEISFNKIIQRRWVNFCYNDLKQCPECFPDLELVSCKKGFNDFQFSEAALENVVNSLLGTRDLDYGLYKDKLAVIKRVTTFEDLTDLERQVVEMIWYEKDPNPEEGYEITALERIFMDNNRAGGSVVCGLNSERALLRFVGLIDTFSLKHTYLLLNLNIQPLLLSMLNATHLPIPHQFKTFGFTSINSYEGRSIKNYFNSDFLTRLKIGKLLLEAVIKLTLGSKNFRVYMTDMTADNIVVDHTVSKLTFVDLDNVIVVDVETFGGIKNRHVHEWIECDGCFAYSPSDVCGHSLSDMNIYAACQFLSRDLHERRLGGFLHDVPQGVIDTVPELQEVLEFCVDCDRININACDRFSSANQLINIMNTILK